MSDIVRRDGVPDMSVSIIDTDVGPKAWFLHPKDQRLVSDDREAG